MNRTPETAFIALATTAALVAGPMPEVAPHQPEARIEQQEALGATAAHAVMHTETLATTVQQERPNAPRFSDSPEATAPPTDRQEDQFEFAVRRATAGGRRLRLLEVTTTTSDEARSTAADRVTGGVGIQDQANEALAETTSSAVAPVYERIAEGVTGYEVPTHVMKGHEVVHPELAAKVVELARVAKMSPTRLVGAFNTDPAKLSQAARTALDVFKHDRTVQVALTTTREFALPEAPTAVPTPRRKEPTHTLQEGTNQLPAVMGGPGYNDFAHGAGNKRSAETAGITSAQHGTNQTSITGHGIKQPRPSNYSGAKGDNMPRNGRARGGNKY